MTCQKAMDLVYEIEQLAQPAKNFDTQVNQLRPFVRPEAARLAAGEPSFVADVSKDLTNAVFELQHNEAEGFDRARDHLQGWTGHAADNFGDYLAEAKSASDVLRIATADLNTLYANYQALVEACHVDLIEILTKARDSLQGVLKQDANIVLTVASVAVALIPGGTALELAATAASGALQVAAVVVSGSGDTREGVVQSLLVALNGLDDQTSAKARKIKDGLDSLYSWIGRQPHVRDVQPERPLILTSDHFHPDDFTLPDEMHPPKPTGDRPLTSQGEGAISRRLDGEEAGAAEAGRAHATA
jgi:hypothetical protein